MSIMRTDLLGSHVVVVVVAAAVDSDDRLLLYLNLFLLFGRSSLIISWRHFLLLVVRVEKTERTSFNVNVYRTCFRFIYFPTKPSKNGKRQEGRRKKVP